MRWIFVVRISVAMFYGTTVQELLEGASEGWGERQEGVLEHQRQSGANTTVPRLIDDEDDAEDYDGDIRRRLATSPPCMTQVSFSNLVVSYVARLEVL